MQVVLETIELLKGLAQLVEIIGVEKMILGKALSSDFKDFEDAIQYFAADSITEMDGIITRNQNDFKKSKLPVLAPADAIALLNM